MWSLNLKVGITVFISIMILVILLISATDSPFERRGDFVTVHFNFVNDYLTERDVIYKVSKR